MLFDTHCHLDDPAFDGDRAAILDDMEAQGITPCVLVGADIPSSRACGELANARPWLYFAAGVHPHEAKTYGDEAHEALLGMMGRAKCVAWGEIGLDYHYDHSPRAVQREAFARQLDAAAEKDLPVIFHVREAHEDVLAILRERASRLPRGVLHCFSGSAEQAKVYLDMGLYISLAGPVTFKNAPRLEAIARLVPDDRLLIETDSPYLSPEPLRGRRNDPRNVAHVARRAACLRGVPYEALCEATRRNGMELFRIGEYAR